MEAVQSGRMNQCMKHLHMSRLALLLALWMNKVYILKAGSRFIEYISYI